MMQEHSTLLAFRGEGHVTVSLSCPMATPLHRFHLLLFTNKGVIGVCFICAIYQELDIVSSLNPCLTPSSMLTYTLLCI